MSSRQRFQKRYIFAKNLSKAVKYLFSLHYWNYLLFCCRWYTKIIEVNLFKNYIYWSIAVGTSCYFLSDISFLAILPAILGDIGTQTTDIAVMMTVHFGFDLFGRICYSLLNLKYRTRNRIIYFVGAVLTVVCRISKYWNWFLI